MFLKRNKYLFVELSSHITNILSFFFKHTMNKNELMSLKANWTETFKIHMKKQERQST